MRLIDADALPYENQVMSYDDEWCLKVSDIDKAPTIDPKDLLHHGRWIKYHHSYFGIHQCVCSECKDEEYWKKYYCYGYESYCPNCGAIMDLEE